MGHIFFSRKCQARFTSAGIHFACVRDLLNGMASITTDSERDLRAPTVPAMEVVSVNKRYHIARAAFLLLPRSECKGG